MLATPGSNERALLPTSTKLAADRRAAPTQKIQEVRVSLGGGRAATDPTRASAGPSDATDDNVI